MPKFLALFAFLIMVSVAHAAPSPYRGEVIISTSGVLGASEEFVSPAVDVTNYSMTTLTLHSPEPSAVDGLRLEVSMNGTDWDFSKPVTHHGGSRVHTLVVTAPFYRVRYLNGATPQTVFRLNALGHTSKNKHLTSTASQMIDDDSDVELMRSASRFDTDVARGAMRDYSWAVVSGFNPAVGTTEEAIWSPGGDYSGFLAANSTLEVVSDDATDNVAGTGARIAQIVGLDGDFNEREEVFVMNGTTPVVSIHSDWRRINQFLAPVVGSCNPLTPSTNCSNHGTLTLRVQGGGLLVAQIDPEQGLASHGVFSVPAGRVGILRSSTIDATEDNQDEITVSLWARSGIEDSGAKFLLFRDVEFSGLRHQQFSDSPVIEGPADIWWSAVRTGNQDVPVNIILEVLVVPER